MQRFENLCSATTGRMARLAAASAPNDGHRLAGVKGAVATGALGDLDAVVGAGDRDHRRSSSTRSSHRSVCHLS